MRPSYWRAIVGVRVVLLLSTFQALLLSLDMDLTERILFCIAGIASLEVLQGNLPHAARYFGELIDGQIEETED